MDVLSQVVQIASVKTGPEESSDDDDDSDGTILAPTELCAEFLKAVMEKDYKVAHKLCQMILLYEPENHEANAFSPLIEEMLRIEGERGDTDGDDSEETDEDSGESDDSGDTDEDSSDSDSSEDGSSRSCSKCRDLQIVLKSLFYWQLFD
uniref:Glutamate rich 2 n=1 Tax=Leptobrachium leishanense TaxID=445787 RepID=A0A8C5RA10_9ANUR